MKASELKIGRFETKTGMNDQERPDLALKVAEAMGDASAVIVGGHCYRDEDYPTSDGTPATESALWQPTLGGDAGAEVEDWLDAQGIDLDVYRNLAGERVCRLWSERRERSGYGETRWIALCRAVVAWSEQ